MYSFLHVPCEMCFECHCGMVEELKKDSLAWGAFFVMCIINWTDNNNYHCTDCVSVDRGRATYMCTRSSKSASTRTDIKTDTYHNFFWSILLSSCKTNSYVSIFLNAVPVGHSSSFHLQLIITIGLSNW